jgi:hypothetical protein
MNQKNLKKYFFALLAVLVLILLASLASLGDSDRYIEANLRNSGYHKTTLPRY